MNLAKLLEDTRTVISDLDEAHERLRAAPTAEQGFAQPVSLHSSRRFDDAEGPATRIRLGSLGSPAKSTTDAARIRLGALPGPSRRKLLEDFAAAGSTKRSELVDEQRTELFSIVFALYRPGPAFRTCHTLASNALDAKVSPGGKSWQETLTCPDPTRPGKSLDEMLQAIALFARHCARLDQQNGDQAGSGFLLTDGKLVTARHVVLDPGWLFGNPSDPACNPGWVRYNRVSGASPGAEAMIPAIGHNATKAATLDMAIISQSSDWRKILAASAISPEFDFLPGLAMQTEPLSEGELRRRPVAVIGHPLQGNARGDHADIPIVFGDASLGTKRFMPGQIDGEKPVLEVAGRTFLSHDCSTLGGASGSGLFDLSTGRVLGIHVTGDAFTGNRAVPSWIVADKLAQAQVE
jgi:hypothetical protein